MTALKWARMVGSAVLAASAHINGCARAEGFTGQDFLEMPEERQKFWLNGAISALGHAAFVKDEAIGTCILDWYFKEDNSAENGIIFASFEQYPDYAPALILISITEGECGRYVRPEVRTESE